MGLRASGSRASRPNRRAEPEVGCTAESSILTNVVLPAPFGPNSPNVVPLATRSEIPFTAGTSLGVQFSAVRERKIFVRPSVSIAYSLITPRIRRLARFRSADLPVGDRSIRPLEDRRHPISVLQGNLGLQLERFGVERHAQPRP